MKHLEVGDSVRVLRYEDIDKKRHDSYGGCFGIDRDDIDSTHDMYECLRIKEVEFDEVNRTYAYRLSDNGGEIRYWWAEYMLEPVFEEEEWDPDKTHAEDIFGFLLGS